MTSPLAPSPSPSPTSIEVAYDFHCPYARRVVEWLDALPSNRATVSFRALPLEQVNRDPEADAWRIWEQPLDYEHHRGRRDRRGLVAFLAADLVRAVGDSAVARRFRGLVYAARFDDALDISDPVVLDACGVGAGLPAGTILAGLADPAAVAAGRAAIEADWRHLRAEYETFGTPTLRIEGSVPFYLKIREAVPRADAERFLDHILAFRAVEPRIAEFKEPDRAGPG